MLAQAHLCKGKLKRRSRRRSWGNSSIFRRKGTSYDTALGQEDFFFTRASGLVSSTNLLPGEHCPLRIPVLRKKRPEDLAAVSPRSKCGRDSALSTVAKEKPSCPLLSIYYQLGNLDRVLRQAIPILRFRILSFIRFMCPRPRPFTSHPSSK